MIATPPTTRTALVRYGAVPEVARCVVGADVAEVGRGDEVVVRTHRGLHSGSVLEVLRPVSGSEKPTDFEVVRRMTDDDHRREAELRAEAALEIEGWNARIHEWQLELVLLDLEWTLDREKRILYVMNERGPDCTQLALRAAAAGLGIIEVQPVGADGPVPLETGGGGGCGSGGGCGCSH